MPAMISDEFSNLPPDHAHWIEVTASLRHDPVTPCCGASWVQYETDRRHFAEAFWRCSQCKLREGKADGHPHTQA